MAGRMAGRMYHPQARIPENHLVPVGEAAFHGRNGLHPETVHRTVYGGGLYQKPVVGMEREGNAVELLDPLHTEHMVHMTVGIYREDGPQPLLLDKPAQRLGLLRRIVAGIDHHGLAGLVPQDVCILLKRIECQSGYLHFSLVLISGGPFRQYPSSARRLFAGPESKAGPPGRQGQRLNLWNKDTNKSSAKTNSFVFAETEYLRRQPKIRISQAQKRIHSFLPRRSI